MASVSAEYYFRNSLAPATRDTYDTAIRRWKAFCERRGWEEHEPITARRVVEWISEMADEGSLSAGTIRAYKSALREYHVSKAGPGWIGGNPCDDEYVVRVLNGVSRARAEVAGAKGEEQDTPNALTPEIVLSLRDRHPISDPRKAMIYAAMALGVCCLMRPSELLGSPQYPERALLRSQLHFYPDENNGSREVIPEAGKAYPSLAKLSLSVSKTDQGRKGITKYIAAPFAIKALWDWCLVHGPWDVRGELFALPGPNGKRLLPAQFLEHIRSEMQATGRDPSITLKAMRRGGASALASAGAPESVVATAGHWSARASQQHYLTNQAQRARAIAIAKALQPVNYPAAAQR